MSKKFSTRGGAECTEEECKLIDSLKRLAEKWRKTPNRLWLYSGSGQLYVMMNGDVAGNDTPELTSEGGNNPDNIILTVNIPNDGGDW